MRLGDIVSALPMMKAEHDAGREVSCIVSPNFAAVFDGVSYVKPILLDTHDRDVEGGERYAKQLGFERILATQVNGNPRKPIPETENFITWQWQFGGYLDQFHTLPLVFDRRDPLREDEAVRRIIPSIPHDLRPVLLYALHGHSSPFYKFAEFERWLLTCFSHKYRCIDIGKCKLPKPYDLLGLYERAEVLITIDTAHCHLSYATQTPTIVMSRGDSRWHWSEPRSHWVGHVTYEDAVQQKGQDKIRMLLGEMDWYPGRLNRGAKEAIRERIWHVFDWYCPYEAKENRRPLNALRTWEHLRDEDRHWELVYHETDRHAWRTSKDIGDSRKLPFVNDVFDFGCQKVSGDGIIVWTNADICLDPDAANIIRRKMANSPCAYARRIDVQDASQSVPRSHLVGQPVNPGVDLIAFRKSWWEQVKGSLPLMYIGAEGFDFVLRKTLLKTNLDCEIRAAFAYHEKHPPKWMEPGVIQNSPAQKHNRKVCSEWAIANGFGKALHQPGESQFLFKPDGNY